MQIETITVGSFETNCYLAIDPASQEAVIIDPGDDADEILRVLAEKKCHVTYILLTHGHFDHMQACDAVRKATGAPLAVHADDAELLTYPEKVSSMLYVDALACQAPDLLLHNGDVIAFGGYQLQVIYTPGHSRGGCCFYELGQKVCFTGDTLFRGSIGRTDLYGGNYAELLHSVRKRLLILEDAVEIYPGHGPASTMQFERKINQFLK